MNKYLVTIPYDCVQYGEMSCVVYAECEEDAIDLAEDRVNWTEDEYEDGDQDNFTYNYERLQLSLDSENVTPPETAQTNETVNSHNSANYTPYKILPDYFLAELHLV